MVFDPMVLLLLVLLYALISLSGCLYGASRTSNRRESGHFLFHLDMLVWPLMAIGSPL